MLFGCAHACKHSEITNPFGKRHSECIIYEHYGSYHDYNKANGTKGKNCGKSIAILVKGKIGHQKIRVNAKAFVQFILFGNIIQFLIAFEVEALQSKGNNGVLFFKAFCNLGIGSRSQAFGGIVFLHDSYYRIFDCVFVIE